MNSDITDHGNTQNGKIAAGLILLVLGGILLVRQFSLFFIPDWLFSWPVWLIGWGVYMGAKHNFKKPSWVFMILLGVAFLIDQNIHHAAHLVWPIAMIILGAWVILKPGKQTGRYFEEKHEPAKPRFNFDKDTDAV